MNKAAETPQLFRTERLLNPLSLLALILILMAATHGQTVPLRSQNNYGLVSISEFERLNLLTGSLSFRLPLARLEARGIGNGVFINIEPKWRIDNTETPYHLDVLVLDPFSSFKVKSEIGGHVHARRAVLATETNQFCWGSEERASSVGFSIVFSSYHGSSYTFRSVLKNGLPASFTYENGCFSPSGGEQGTEFVSWEDSRVRFISDEPIWADNNPASYSFVVSGKIMLPDGTALRVDNGLVTNATDRNGNRTYTNYQVNPTADLPSDETVSVTSVTDSLDREINVGSDNVQFHGSGGVVRAIDVNYTTLPSALAPGHSIQTLQQLFSWSGAVDVCMTPPGSEHCTDPQQIGVVNQIDLPNGQSYRFYYNSYAELARVELPTGGILEYEYEFAAARSFDRRVKLRRLYSSSGILESKTEYSYSHFYESGPLPAEVSTVVKIKDADENLKSQVKHYFKGEACVRGSSTIEPADSQFYGALARISCGQETRTETYAGDGSSLLRRFERNYGPRTTIHFGGPLSFPIDMRVISVYSHLMDSGQVSKTEFGYDPTTSYNLLTDTYEYDYGQGVAGNFIRRTHTEYEKSPSYTGSSVNLLVLPVETWVANNLVRVSRTRFEYDNYSTEANHSPLISRNNITGHDSLFGLGYTTRGNVTQVTQYADAENENGAVSVYSQYDIAGNIVKTIDGRGKASTIDYGDRFGLPDGDARLNSPPPSLDDQQTYAFATSATNPVGHTAYSQFDYFTGAAVDTESIIGTVNTTFYNDSLDRPTQTVWANNRPQLRRQITFIYDDLADTVVATGDSKVFADNLIKSQVYCDGLGRTIETRFYETSINYIKLMTEYDSLGRPYKTSNPFRPYLNEQPRFTTKTFDALGRVIQIKTPDNATLNRSYDGSTTTVTDQSGRKRRTSFDALGRVQKIIEDPDGLGYETDYVYDALGRLRKTSQISGSVTQNRFFMLDDLGRLIRAKQSELLANANLGLTDPVTGNADWSVKYEYDANGNVVSTTDANNRTITATYDDLNRRTFQDYSDSTPDVIFEFDDSSIPNSRGQLTAVISSVSATRYTAFDELGRIKASKQSTSGSDYVFPDYRYNLAGALESTTYPSGRLVKTELDDIGRLSKITSQLPNQVERVYLSNLSYTSFGSVQHGRLGNGRWESRIFDANRLYAKEIRLGGSAGDSSLLNVEYDYGSINNNGSILQQTITLPAQATPIVQNYVYDGLNRLYSATETFNSQVAWKQTFEYDRFGNRRFDAANTTTLPSNNGIYNPQIDITNNRLTLAEGYAFDAEGNLTSNPEGQILGYDAENRLVQIQNTATQTTVTHYYDGNGKRVRKLVGQDETIFVYDAFGKLVAEYSTVTDQRPKTISYLTSDSVGSPRLVTNQIGQVVARHDYTAFGEEVPGNVGGRATVDGYQNADGVRQQFTGYERDVESGLDFAQARYFKPLHGRFTSVDPLAASASIENPQTFNRYSYALNNPYNLTDPLGQSACGVGAVGSGKVCTQGDDEEKEKEKKKKPDCPPVCPRLILLGPGENPIDYPIAIVQSERAVDPPITTSDSQPSLMITPLPTTSLLVSRPLPPGHPCISDVRSLACQAEQLNMMPIIPSVPVGAGGGFFARILQRILAAVGVGRSAPVANGVTRAVLQGAARSTGPTVRVVTKLDSPPALGRALSVATGEGADSLAAAARSSGSLYEAQIPKELIDKLIEANMAQESITLMNGVVAREIRFQPEASEFIIQFFQP